MRRGVNCIFERSGIFFLSRRRVTRKVEFYYVVVYLYEQPEASKHIRFCSSV